MLLRFIIVVNLLAAAYAYYVPRSASVIGGVNAMSEMAELEHAGAIDPAKLNQYNPKRYPTTAAAEEAIRSGAITKSIYGPLNDAARQSAWMPILIALANTILAVVGLAIIVNREAKRAPIDG